MTQIDRLCGRGPNRTAFHSFFTLLGATLCSFIVPLVQLETCRCLPSPCPHSSSQVKERTLHFFTACALPDRSCDRLVPPPRLDAALSIWPLLPPSVNNEWNSLHHFPWQQGQQFSSPSFHVGLVLEALYLSSSILDMFHAYQHGKPCSGLPFDFTELFFLHGPFSASLSSA